VALITGTGAAAMSRDNKDRIVEESPKAERQKRPDPQPLEEPRAAMTHSTAKR
jgi:hypothetical protein